MAPLTTAGASIEETLSQAFSALPFLNETFGASVTLIGVISPSRSTSHLTSWGLSSSACSGLVTAPTIVSRFALRSTLQRASPKAQDRLRFSTPPLMLACAHVLDSGQRRSSPAVSFFTMISQRRFSQALRTSRSFFVRSRACVGGGP